MSKIPKCNPEVYRRAAELIDSDLVYYSCNAVCKAASKLGYSRRSADYYLHNTRLHWVIVRIPKS